MRPNSRERTQNIAAEIAPATAPAVRIRPATAFTLLEAMILVVILGIIGVAVGVGLQAVVAVPEAVETRLGTHALLVQKMEEMSTISFAALALGTDDSGNPLSDTCALGNKTVTRTVTVAEVDADGDGNLDPDFLELTVAINGQSLKTRVSSP